MPGPVTVQDAVNLGRTLAINADGSINVTAAGAGDAVTIADGADVTQGAKADAKSTATDTTPITIVSILKQVSFSIQAAATSLASLVTGTVLAAGSAIIGKVGIDQTTPGTTNAVSFVSASGALQETTITLGGTAQDLFSSATPTNGFEIVNPPSATETLYFREANTATVAGATSMPIVVGGSYVSPLGYDPTGRISVIAATTGHPVIARRW